MLWPQKHRKSTTPRKAPTLSLLPFGSKSTGIEFSNRTQSDWNRFDCTEQSSQSCDPEAVLDSLVLGPVPIWNSLRPSRVARISEIAATIHTGARRDEHHEAIFFGPERSHRPCSSREIGSEPQAPIVCRFFEASLRVEYQKFAAVYRFCTAQQLIKAKPRGPNL